jgi:nucleoside-diphosphate-sugar epimerase
MGVPRHAYSGSMNAVSDVPNAQRMALVVGSTGIVGGNLANHLVNAGWTVYGMARNPQANAGIRPLAADLLNPESVQKAVADIPFTNVFFCTWMRQNTEKENVAVNGAMISNLFEALRGRKSMQHAALVTGTKHYLGPFESYGQKMAETPFREDQPRLPGENFYYTQEDVLFKAAEQGGFGWTVHRPHTIVGFALGNAMNIGVTLAVYATICRETGQPFIYPGSRFQWNALTDVTDARLLARHLEWAAVTSAAHNQAFNVANGDVFRWRWLWPQLAAYFGIEAAEYPERVTPLEEQLKNAAPLWEKIAAKYNLVENRIDKLASPWHTDADLGREIECVNDMARSRRLGFNVYQETPASFFDVFDQLKSARVIPG